MALIVERKLDTAQKVEIVILEDAFGAKMVLQHPLLKEGYDAEAQEQAALKMMEQNERKFRERAESRGHKL